MQCSYSDTSLDALHNLLASTYCNLCMKYFFQQEHTQAKGQIIKSAANSGALPDYIILLHSNRENAKFSMRGVLLGSRQREGEPAIQAARPKTVSFIPVL